MNNLMIFILLVYGFTYLISEAVIFDKIREKIRNKFFKKLINCPTCTSFWVGIVVSIFFPIVPFYIFNGIIALAATNIIQKLIAY